MMAQQANRSVEAGVALAESLMELEKQSRPCEGQVWMVGSILAVSAAAVVLPREKSLRATTLPPMVQRRRQAVPPADCPSAVASP